MCSGYPTFVFDKIWTQTKMHAAGSWHWGWLGIDTAVNTEEVHTGSLYTKGGTMYLWSGSSNYMANYPSGQGDLTYSDYPKLGAVAYGGVGQPFEGLPHELDCIFSMPDDATAYASKGSNYYKLQLTTQVTGETESAGGRGEAALFGACGLEEEVRRVELGSGSHAE